MAERHQVSGVLFVDYISMMRSRKDCNWEEHLLPEDMPYLEGKIVSEDWYPMTTFERLGNAILAEVADGMVEAVRAWGKMSVAQMLTLHPSMIAKGDPLESLMRVQVLRSTFFSFPAFKSTMLAPENAHIEIQYHMGATAERAAAYQAMGFFEEVLQQAGAKKVQAEFQGRAWANHNVTLLDLRWKLP